MITFILGGVKGGKSMFAQCIAKHLAETQNTPLCYIATMIPYDNEDEKRIQRHISDRNGWGFSTFEEGLNMSKLFDKLPNDSTILMDSVTAYVQNNLFCPDSLKKEISVDEMFEDISGLYEKSKNIIFVSDYIFSDSMRYTDSVYEYLEVLGKLHCKIAQSADTLIECAYSNMKYHKKDLSVDFAQIEEKYYALDSHLEYFDI